MSKSGLRCRSGMIAFVLCVVVWFVVPDPALAGTITVTPSPPVPMQPMEVTVTGEACDPFASVEVRLERENFGSDVSWIAPMLATTVSADANGDFSATITTTAYPGFWMADASCGTDHLSFTVPDIPGMVMSVSPSSVVAGSTASITVSGAACPGASVHWWIGPAPNIVDGGRVPVAADGSWSATASFVVPSHLTGLPVGAGCELGDNIVLSYPSASLRIEAPPTTTSPPNSGPVTASPSFTG